MMSWVSQGAESRLSVGFFWLESGTRKEDPETLNPSLLQTLSRKNRNPNVLLTVP